MGTPKKKGEVEQRCWRITVAERRRSGAFESVLVLATSMEEAGREALRHCASPGLDLEVTSAERLPTKVIVARGGR